MDRLKFEKLKPVLSFLSGPEDPELPFRISVIYSGWSDPQSFHVIIEDGERDDYESRLMTREQIFNEYGLEIPHIDINQLIKDKTNDMDLGSSVRKLFS